jgi:hypothetical protein
MKMIVSFLALISLGCSLSSCATTTQPEVTQLSEAMKGYELYSWQEDSHWVFSLLIGTNREKSLDEIRSPTTTLTDVNALLAMLEKVPSGHYVTWSSKKTVSFPPDTIVKQIEKTCKDIGLILYIVK